MATITIVMDILYYILAGLGLIITVYMLFGNND